MKTTSTNVDESQSETETMADKNRVSMPASTAGITRYFEDYRSKIELKPVYVLVLALLIIAILVILNATGGALLG